MSTRTQPRIIDFHPTPRREPLHAIDLKPAHLPRMKTLMSAEPVFQAIVDPAVEMPEHRVHMGRERIAEEVVFRRIPARGKVRRIAGERHWLAVGRVARHRGPAHVQPVMQAQFDL
ncbi:hypothetical protein D9M71_579000 [compost metagenome]